ncbi:sensor histidine kinase [Streptomyces sp. NPDC085524]|uniref:sensor histidine kinase n=1 Tax=unclassified Streptomyces TaxID=2593676 RepID=UPI0035DB7607
MSLPQQSDEPYGPEPDEHRDLPAPRLARVILTAALLSYLLITTLNIWSAHTGPRLLLTGLACLTAIFCIQLRHSSPGASRRPRWQNAVTLGAQALLTYLPVILFKAVWGAMAGFFAGSLLLLLPARAAWGLYAAVGLSMLAPPLLEGRPVLDSIYLCQSTLLTGLVVFGLTRLADLVNVLHETRGRLARLAVTKERLRFARDLHDLLGYSLSAITLKSEVVRRILPTHPERAMEEIREVLEISRQSLSDVRTVASRLRDMSLAEEAESAESLLISAEVAVHVRIEPGAMGRRTDTVLAAVLREAVTNLIRHSKATRCEIEAVRSGDRVRLSVRNDGADPAHRDPSPDGGTGLESLAARLAEVGGSMSTVHAGEGTFLLVAEADAFPADPEKQEKRGRG